MAETKTQDTAKKKANASKSTAKSTAAKAKKTDDSKVKSKTTAKAEKEVKEVAEEKQPEVELNAKRQKKKERRDAKAARKAANREEEKRTTPNNLLLAILIFGIIFGMFAFIGCYNYFSKPASIEKYMEKNGGSEVYGNMQVDAYTTAAITAKGNAINIDLNAKTDEDDAIKQITENYKGKEGKKNLQQLAAYFLTSMKPQVRGLSASADIKVTLNDKKLNSTHLTYKQAKKVIKDAQKEAEEQSQGESE